MRTACDGGLLHLMVPGVSLRTGPRPVDALPEVRWRVIQGTRVAAARYELLGSSLSFSGTPCDNRSRNWASAIAPG